MNKDCMICGASVEAFMSFGKMPVANAFLMPDAFQRELFYNLTVGFCQHCAMVQLMEFVDREKLFHDHYAYYSSISNFMKGHFKHFAESVTESHLRSSDPFVVEIGSNDGIMLQNFGCAGIRHLGVEPSANVARAAMEKGVNTVCRFFDKDVASEIREKYGYADLILAANVMCHIPYLNSIVEAVDCLLKPDGVFIFEDPYLGDIVENTAYDQIYDEHAFYFSVTALGNLFDRYGFEIIDTETQNVHGGSMRYTVARKGRKGPSSQSVIRQKQWEQDNGLHTLATFHKFRGNIEVSRDKLILVLEQIKAEGGRIVGYGATSKSTTVLNYCDIDTRLIDFISDTTPNKQGKYSPGKHIPIKPYEAFADAYPDYSLLFAWNHRQEIMEKEQAYMRQGGKFIIYVPTVQLLPRED